MNVYDILRNENARITLGCRWLVCDLIDPKKDVFDFKIYERRTYARVPQILYEGNDENKACEILISNE